MSIGKKPKGAPAPTAKDKPESPPPAHGEWCVPVAGSVIENVPMAILRNWMIVEGFARDQPECWPSNKAVAARMGVNRRASQLAIEALEDHGIVVRKLMPGNHRSMLLVRRTSQSLSAAEWKTMAERAERRAAGRIALAKAERAERKRYKPPTRIVG